MTRMVAALAGICAAVSLAAEDRPPQIRSGVELVAVDVQVVDRAGNPVPNLTRDDFEVWIDGRKPSVGNVIAMDNCNNVAGKPTVKISLIIFLLK